MTGLHRKKAEFTEQYLRPLLIATGIDICEVEYKADENEDGFLYNERVVVTFVSGYQIEANVGMDSFLAMAKDTLKVMPL